MLPFDTLTAAAKELLRKSLSARELASVMLDRIESLNPKIGAMTDVSAETALEEADKVDRQRQDGGPVGPLAGIPIVIKDLIDTTPAVCSAGLKFLANYRPKRDATVVRNLRRAGAVILGVTATDSGAFDVRTPEVTHPLAPELIVGGSSGGSGAAIAAGFGYAALGTDTGGSIRIPAACCQVTGFMPSSGRVSMDGIRPLAWSLDHVGPIAKSVADIGLVQPILDPRFSKTGGQKRNGALTVGHDPKYYGDAGYESQVAMLNVLEVCRGLGVEIREITLPHPDDAFDMHLTIFRGEAAAYHLSEFSDQIDEYPPLPRLLLEKGRELPAHDYVLASRKRAKITRQIDEWFNDIDFILAPTLPVMAPSRDAKVVTVGGREMAILNALIRYTFLFDHIGTPVVSVPVTCDGPGMGASVQIIGRTNTDAAVIDFAERIENVLSLSIDYTIFV